MAQIGQISPSPALFSTPSDKVFPVDITPPIEQLEPLRPLGKLEQLSAACHHLGYFNNVGLTAQYHLPTSPEEGTTVLSELSQADLHSLVYAAAARVVRANRVLSVVPVNESSPRAYFASLPEIDLTRVVSFAMRSAPLDGAGEDGDDEELDALLVEQQNTDFKADYGTLPFWRLVILQDPRGGNRFTASFIFHHAIGDGMSGMIFHKAFRNALDEVSSAPASELDGAEIVVPDENVPLLPPLEELHPLPLMGPNPACPAPPHDNFVEWSGNRISIPCTSNWRSTYFPPNVSRSFVKECKAQKVSVTAGLSSIVARALFDSLPPTTQALRCVIPISLRPWLQLPREVANATIGTHFDAATARITRPDEDDDIWPGATQACKALDAHIQNVSPTGEPYTAVAVFKNVPDIGPIFASLPGQRRQDAFEVTNVGMFPSATARTNDDAARPLWQVGKVALSRSANVIGAAVTVTAATGGDGSMTIGLSWQEGIVSKEMMEQVNQGIREHFKRYQ